MPVLASTGPVWTDAASIGPIPARYWYITECLQGRLNIFIFERIRYRLGNVFYRTRLTDCSHVTAIRQSRSVENTPEHGLNSTILDFTDMYRIASRSMSASIAMQAP